MGKCVSRSPAPAAGAISARDSKVHIDGATLFTNNSAENGGKRLSCVRKSQEKRASLSESGYTLPTQKKTTYQNWEWHSRYFESRRILYVVRLGTLDICTNIAMSGAASFECFILTCILPCSRCSAGISCRSSFLRGWFGTKHFLSPLSPRVDCYYQTHLTLHLAVVTFLAGGRTGRKGQ